jgi:hypothetical protein
VQRGRGIGDEDADLLVAYASSVIVLIQGGLEARISPEEEDLLPFRGGRLILPPAGS